MLGGSDLKGIIEVLLNKALQKAATIYCFFLVVCQSLFISLDKK